MISLIIFLKKNQFRHIFLFFPSDLTQCRFFRSEKILGTIDRRFNFSSQENLV